MIIYNKNVNTFLQIKLSYCLTRSVFWKILQIIKYFLQCAVVAFYICENIINPVYIATWRYNIICKIWPEPRTSVNSSLMSMYICWTCVHHVIGPCFVSIRTQNLLEIHSGTPTMERSCILKHISSNHYMFECATIVNVGVHRLLVFGFTSTMPMFNTIENRWQTSACCLKTCERSKLYCCT